MANWDIFRELDSLRKEIDEAFRGFGVSRPFAATFLSPLSTRRFPVTNLSEDGEKIYIDALVPGVDPKEMELTLLRNTVTISGERKPRFGQKGEIVHRSELGFGRFSRTLELPMDIEPERSSAEMRDGVIRITLAKAESAKPKKIDVKLS